MVEISRFKNISFKKMTECAVCGSKSRESTIELPDFPLTEIYVDERITEKVGYLDQNFHLCKNCGHAQISNIIDHEILYGSSYYFRTSTSATGVKANDFFLSFMNRIIGNRHFKTIIEIGCSDVYLLKCLKPIADRLIGIDPVLKDNEDELSDDKITAIGDFFENINLGKYMHANDAIVLCSHALEHMDNPKAMLRKLFDNSSDSTLFFFQFPCLETLVDNCRFDQIFHQHLHYFSLYSFAYLLNELGGELIDFEMNPLHWGTLLVVFKKAQNNNANPLRCKLEKVGSEKLLENYDIFKKRMNLTNKYLGTIKGEKVYGYGAALMLPTLSYHLKNDFSTLDCIIDDDKNKEGLFYINLPVPIRTPADLNLKDATILITAIDNSRQILNRAISLNPKRIILPINNI